MSQVTEVAFGCQGMDTGGPLQRPGPLPAGWQWRAGAWAGLGPTSASQPSRLHWPVSEEPPQAGAVLSGRGNMGTSPEECPSVLKHDVDSALPSLLPRPQPLTHSQSQLLHPDSACLHSSALAASVPSRHSTGALGQCLPKSPAFI